MAEPTVQVPQCPAVNDGMEGVRCHGDIGHTELHWADVSGDGDVTEWGDTEELWDEIDHLRALLSQPTPTAEGNYLADELEVLIPEVRRTARPGHGGSAGKYAEGVMRRAVEALRAQSESTAERFAIAIASTAHDSGASFFDAVEFGEPVQYNGHNGLAVFADAARRLSEKTAEPPRIEDMAPGTTFVASLVGLSFPEACELLSSGLVYTRGMSWSVDNIDPSTIRDVTPPK